EIRGFRSELPELNKQAFLQAGGGNPRGVELLDAVENGDNFVQVYVQSSEGFVKLFNGRCHKALVVDGVDDGFGDQPILVGHRGQVELPVKMIPKGVGNGVKAVEV